MIQLGLLGSRGRMGHWVEKLLASEYANQATLAATANREEPLSSLLTTDVIIDFSSADACLLLAKTLLTRAQIKGPSTAPEISLPIVVVGSTGWANHDRRVLEQLATKTLVMVSANFSTGVWALRRLLKTAAPLLDRLGYQPVMVETHHCHKKDAPSGTATLLAQTIDSASKHGPISIHSIRAGEVIGEHELTFYGPADQIKLGHYAQDRSVFARGAIDAALWLHKNRTALSQAKEMISMDDYLDDLLKT